MPDYTRASLQCALMYLGMALLLEMARGIAAMWGGSAWFIGMRATIAHLFFVGWLTQLIFGVAYWLFPTASKSALRGSATVAWWSFGALNSGLMLRLVGEPWHLYRPTTYSAILLVLSALAQWVAVLLFTVNIWGRVKPKPSSQKQAQPEL